MFQSLQALAVADAYGENELKILPDFYRDRMPWTDDTAMAKAICRCLDEDGFIDQDKLARYFAESYDQDPHRGYGRGTANLLQAIQIDGQWKERSANWWGPGIGSHGNGGAMRVGPLGVYFDPRVYSFEHIARQARLSAEVTHNHPEAIAGAVAVAIAASMVTYNVLGPTGKLDWDAILLHIDGTEVGKRVRVMSTANLFRYEDVAYAFGNGSQVTAIDTVPFCLWAANEALIENDFALTMENVLKVGGDTDTNCAIVAGIIGNRIHPPDEWVHRTEPLSAK